MRHVNLSSCEPEYILRILQTKKIPYTSYDLASDDDAKRLWRRKAPPGAFDLILLCYCAYTASRTDSADKQQLPGILVGGKFSGVCPYPRLLNSTHRSCAEQDFDAL